MTKIIKKETEENMHSHKQTLVFLKDHLASGYSEEAERRLKKKGITVSRTMIRNIKSGLNINWKVLEVLAEIALESKTAKEKVAALINNN